MFSVGDTLEEAIANAQQAIECHAEGMMLDEEVIPCAWSLQIYRNQPVIPFPGE